MAIITVNSVDYFYRDSGHGPLVILGHSDASSSGQWRGLMEHLEGEFRLLAFDISGQGRSPAWPEGMPYSLGAESAVIDALADLASGPLHLVGHSAGGMFILDAAIRLTGRLESLTLIEPTAFFLLRQKGCREAWTEIQQVAKSFQAQVEAGLSEEAMARFVEYWSEPGGWKAMPEERRKLLVGTVEKICLEWEASFAETSLLETIGMLAVPTLLLRGTRTTLAARTVVDLLADALPNSQLVEIEGAGHLSPITHAQEVISQIAGHLQRPPVQPH